MKSMKEFLCLNFKRNGCRVVVHDLAATPANAPSLNEFEYLNDPATLQKRDDVKLAVIYCPWPQYRGLKLSPGAKLFTPWKL